MMIEAMEGCRTSERPMIDCLQEMLNRLRARLHQDLWVELEAGKTCGAIVSFTVRGGDCRRVRIDQDRMDALPRRTLLEIQIRLAQTLAEIGMGSGRGLAIADWGDLRKG